MPLNPPTTRPMSAIDFNDNDKLLLNLAIAPNETIIADKEATEVRSLSVSINDKPTTAAVRTATATVRAMRLPIDFSIPLAATISPATKVDSAPTTATPFIRFSTGTRPIATATAANIAIEADMASKVVANLGISGPASFVMPISNAITPENATIAAVPLAISPTDIPESILTTRTIIKRDADIAVRDFPSPFISLPPARVVTFANKAITPINAVIARDPLRTSPADKPETSFITPTNISIEADILSKFPPRLDMFFEFLVTVARSVNTPVNAPIATRPFAISLASIPPIIFMETVINNSAIDNPVNILLTLDIALASDPLAKYPAATNTEVNDVMATAKPARI